ncbi:MAG TPA: hypothetical protein VHJ59_06475 [Nitrososphaera sp.]|jgi:hypothetical protein|nr:hypothetical protein [Nitrososphaera sp.]
MKKNDNTGFERAPEAIYQQGIANMLAGAAGALVIAAASISLVMLITHSYLFGSPTVIE